MKLTFQLSTVRFSCCSGLFPGIRSLNFRDEMLTIGTGAGHVYFYDLRAGHFLEFDCGHSLSLSAGKGWLVGV